MNPYPRVGTASSLPVYESSANGNVQLPTCATLAAKCVILGWKIISLVTECACHSAGHSEGTVTGAEGDFEVSVNPDKITGIRADAEGFYVQEGVDLLDITKVGQHVAMNSTFSLAQVGRRMWS